MAAKDMTMSMAAVLREWINVRARLSTVLGLMIDESTDISNHKVLLLYLRFLVDGRYVLERYGYLKMAPGPGVQVLSSPGLSGRDWPGRDGPGRGGGEETRRRGPGGRKVNRGRTRVPFGLIPGAIVHFSTAGATDPRNESLREPLRKDCLGPSGLGIEAWNCAKSGKSLFSALPSVRR